MAVSISGDGAVTGVASVNTDVSATELGYLDGVTSAIQPQINTAGGLVLVGSASMSGSSVSLDNVFTSAYENYRVVVNHTNVTGSTYTQFRLRSSGTDSSAASYTHGLSEQQYGAATLTVRSYGASETYARVQFSTAANSRSAFTFDVLGPKTSTLTFLTINGSTNDRALFGGAAFLATTSFDGFTLYPNSGDFASGTIRVYGYAQ